MRYRLRTLLIVLALLPPLLWVGWSKYQAWRAEQVQREQVMTRRQWLDRFGVSPPPEVLRREGVETGQ